MSLDLILFYHFFATIWFKDIKLIIYASICGEQQSFSHLHL